MSGDTSAVVAEQMNGSSGNGNGAEHEPHPQQQQQLDDEENNGIGELPLMSKTRPADVDADIREMERRKRVDSIMNSRMFREELERIIELQMHDGTPATSSILQRITDMMGMSSNGTRMQSGGTGCGSGIGSNAFRNLNSVMPINDIRGIENIAYDKGEKMLRCKLAALYRLIDQFGWSYGGGGGGLGANNVQNVVTARLSHDLEHFLTNPFGLMFHEITASSLIKADMQGNVVEQGTTNYALNQSGYLLNAAIHATRPDLKCIIGVQTPAIVAVSALKCGLLPLSYEACLLGDVSRHHFATARCSDPEAQRDQIVRDFGPVNKVLLLLNRGAICAGETIEEAFFHLYNLAMACETQLRLIAVPPEQLQLIGDDERKFVYENARRAPDAGVVVGGRRDDAQEAKRWRLGGVEFDALMRMLDNSGFRTGHIARYPLVKSDPPKPRNDCEVPPAVSHLGYLLEEEEMYRQGTWKRQDGSLGHHHRKGNERSRWLNSPNVYQKVEVLETGTVDPKKITKWVAEDSPTHSSTPVRIDPAMQFVPANTNPNEFKKLQKQIKDYRRADKKSAGPQSQILDGVTLEEAQNIQRIAAATAAAAVSSANSTAGGANDRVVLMGAASKGIIQRDYQNNATVYKTPYAKNPFDRVTDEDVVEYRKMVERAASGGARGGDDTDFSESEATSTSAAAAAAGAAARLPPSSASAAAAAAAAAGAKSPTDDDESSSRRQRVVVQVETKHAPKPSQPEIVMSDATALIVTKRNQNSNNHQPHQQRNGRTSTTISKVPKAVTMTSSASASASILKPRFYRTHSHAGFPKGQFIQPNLPQYHIAAQWSPRVSAEPKKPSRYYEQTLQQRRRCHIGIQVGRNNNDVCHRSVQCLLIGNDDTKICDRCQRPLSNRSHDQSVLDAVADHLVQEIEHESGNYQSFEICSDNDDAGDYFPPIVDEYHEDDLFMDQNNNSECWKLTSIQEEEEEEEEAEEDEQEEEKEMDLKTVDSIKQFATILNRFILFEMNNKYNSHDDFYWSELQDYFSVLSFIFYRDQLFRIDRDQFREQITNLIGQLEKSAPVALKADNNEDDNGDDEDEDDYHFSVNELVILVCELMWEDCAFDKQRDRNETASGKSIDIFNSTPQTERPQLQQQPQQIQPFLAYCNDQNNSFELWYSFSRSGENDNGLCAAGNETTTASSTNLNFQLSYGKSLASKYLQKCSFQIYYDLPPSNSTKTKPLEQEGEGDEKEQQQQHQQQSDLNETIDWMGLDSAIF